MIKCGVKWLIITSLTAGFAAAAAAAAAAQAQDLDMGRSEFQSSCASCHGTDAKGKGPVSAQLKIPPPDLTMLAKNNNRGILTNAVYETIDGLKSIPAHGTREMPIWGEQFNPIINLPHYVSIRLIGRWPGRSKATGIRRAKTAGCVFARRLPGFVPARPSSNKRINIVRQVDNGVESFPPNWHFTSAVSGNCFQSIYGFINSVRGKDPVVVLGQHRQIGRRYLKLVADWSFALCIRTMTTRARRLKF